MRVVFSVSNWPGHWFSMVPLGWALQAAGHEVKVLCTPCQSEPITHAGLMPVPVLEAMDMTVRGRLHNYRKARAGTWAFTGLPPPPLTGQPLTSLDEFDMDTWSKENHDWAIGVTARSCDAAVDFARWWQPHLVLNDLMSLEGPLVGRALNIPALLHLWGPIGPQDDVPGAPPGASFVPMDPSNAFARHHAGQMGPEVYQHVIDPSPPTAHPPLDAHRIPIRHIPYNGPGALPPAPASYHGTKPRICVVWGTSVSGVYGPASFAVPRIIEALADLDVEVLLTLTGADRERITQSGPLPPGVRLLERTPLHLLLPACDAVIHHGGAGCTMTALAAGIPQLAIHAGSDQEVIADRLAGVRAAQSLPNAHADPHAIRTAVRRLLDDPVHRRTATQLRQEMTTLPTPAELLDTLTALAH
ncbi:nucleotide disphospho-sugar-binding domain-containing protein [Streptomyces sp. NPDC058000]|uniref:nucleotide disphospho-sugar-binding domain-containing protein n=1 Tax=Streptomyces sp. NPDC058000 TaxID=3346299 RepID=UPI0036EC6D0B